MDNLALRDEFYSFVTGSQDPIDGGILVSRIIDQGTEESWIIDELERLASGFDTKDANAEGLSTYMRAIGFGGARVSTTVPSNRLF